MVVFGNYYGKFDSLLPWSSWFSHRSISLFWFSQLLRVHLSLSGVLVPGCKKSIEQSMNGSINQTICQSINHKIERTIKTNKNKTKLGRKRVISTNKQVKLYGYVNEISLKGEQGINHIAITIYHSSAHDHKTILQRMLETFSGNNENQTTHISDSRMS